MYKVFYSSPETLQFSIKRWLPNGERTPKNNSTELPSFCRDEEINRKDSAQGGRHSSVDPSAPTFLGPQVQATSTTYKLRFFKLEFDI